MMNVGEDKPHLRTCRFCFEGDDTDSQHASPIAHPGHQHTITDLHSSPVKLHSSEFIWFKGIPQVVLSVAGTSQAARLNQEGRKDPLIAPCNCSGTARYVHASCLQRWRTSTPAAFNRCTVCGQEYRFKKHPVATALRSTPLAHMATALILFLLCWLCGCVNAWMPAYGDPKLHLVNGFVLLGLAGIGITMAEMTSPRRTYRLICRVAGGSHVSTHCIWIVTILLRCVASAVMLIGVVWVYILQAGPVSSSPSSWGMVLLAAVGFNPWSLGPAHHGMKHALERISMSLDLSISNYVFEEAEASDVVSEKSTSPPPLHICIDAGPCTASRTHLDCTVSVP